jgi:hypothetical protein
VVISDKGNCGVFLSHVMHDIKSWVAISSWRYHSLASDKESDEINIDPFALTLGQTTEQPSRKMTSIRRTFDHGFAMSEFRMWITFSLNHHLEEVPCFFLCPCMLLFELVVIVLPRNETSALSTALLFCFAEIGNPGTEIIPDIFAYDTFPIFRSAASKEVSSWRKWNSLSPKVFR